MTQENSRPGPIAQALVDAWNNNHSSGTPVIFWPLQEHVGDASRGHRGRTTSPAFVLGGTAPCIMIDVVSGCVHLAQVMARHSLPREVHDSLPSVNPGGDWLTSQSSQRFMLFGGSFTPGVNGPTARGGWHDYVGSYPSIESAERAAKAFSFIWWQVVHRFDLTVVADASEEASTVLYPLEGKWGYAHSEDAEQWYGFCETREEAIGEAQANGYEWICQYRSPAMPWDAFCVEWFGDQVVNQEDWTGDYAEGAWEPSDDDLNTLEERVQEVIRQWCLETRNVPKFGIVDHIEPVGKEDQ